MPKQSFNTGGWRYTGRHRLAPGLLFGHVLEEQREYLDGTVRWHKAKGAFPLPNLPKGFLLGARVWATGRRRIRNGFLGAVAEELMHGNGNQTEAFWCRINVPVELSRDAGVNAAP